MAPVERRADPQFPGEKFTFDEVAEYYARKFKKKDIQAYWDNECAPAKGKAKEKAKSKAKVKVKAKAKAPKEPQAPKSGRFSDPWFRQFDRCTEGFVDALGFVSRLPLRLESSEAMIHGFVDAKKMWADFEGEAFVPILVGGKAVVSIWFNNFTDTDCGGEYWETWYNTFVSNKSEPQIELDAEAGPMGAIAHEKACIYLQRVVCGDTPGNPGAAMKAIVGGRSVFGFPKHPEPGELTFSYEEEDGKKVKWVFNAKHGGKQAVSMTMRLPEADEGAMTIPLDAKTAKDTVIGAPLLGGTHKGHNGAHQVRFGQAFKCTQHVKPWDAKTDTLVFGDDSHYAKNIKTWDFTPILKVHSPDFKIAAFKPSNWMSGRDAAKAVAEHEAKIAAGTKAGAL